MKSTIKTFEIRWGDLDPNRHVANSAYVEFMNDTRMTYMHKNGFTQKKFEEHNVGPVVFNEEYHYLKEIMPREIVHVDVELKGTSEDQRFYRFSHCLYKENGELAVYSELLFGWMDLAERKLRVPPDELLKILNNMPRSDKFQPITKEEMRSDKVPYGRVLELTI